MSTENTEFDERSIEMIGTGSAVMQAVAFTAVGYFTLESIAYGAIAGIFAGVGSYLFLPWFLQLSAIQEEAEEELSFSEMTSQMDGNQQLAVFGLGLDIGSILMIVAGFSLGEANLVVGTGVAVAATLAVYLVGTILLDSQSS